MPDNTPPPDYYEMKISEVRGFFELAKDAARKSDYLLSLHYNGKKALGVETLQKICELHALALSFEGYLEKVFRLTEDLPDTAVYRATLKHATSIIKMTFSISEVQFALNTHGLSFEDH